VEFHRSQMQWGSNGQLEPSHLSQHGGVMHFLERIPRQQHQIEGKKTGGPCSPKTLEGVGGEKHFISHGLQRFGPERGIDLGEGQLPDEGT
jgi:hypothetical protein